MTDPLGYDIPLPSTLVLHPMGFPLRLRTNSTAVAEAANVLWRYYPPQFSGRTIELRVVVGPRAPEPPVPALPRGQHHLVSIVHSPENFATADLARGFAFACLSEDVAADRDYLSYHFLEPLVYLLLDALHLTPVHAACVAKQDSAVLLCGESGAGKTSLAYACARRGWQFLSGDVTHVIRSRRDHTVIGRPFQIRFRAATKILFPELAPFPSRHCPNGKLDLEIDTAHLGLDTRLTARAASIIFLHRGSGKTSANIDHFPALEAKVAFEQVICFGHRALRREHTECLGQLLEQLPVYRLTYADFENAEAALRDLLAAGYR